MMSKKFNKKYYQAFFYLIVIVLFESHPVFYLSPCNASMGSISVKSLNSEQISSSNKITISSTTIKTLATQERIITINDGRASDETQYTVTISESYYMQTTEVTQKRPKTIP